MMIRRYFFVSAAILAAPGAQAANSVLEQQFAQTVRPFVQEYCVACHSGDAPAAPFNLESYKTLDCSIPWSATMRIGCSVSDSSIRY